MSTPTIKKMMSDTEIYLRCVEFVREQSEGEWDEKTIAKDAERMAAMIREIIQVAQAGTDQ
ncbi:hypothetical protein PX554_18010 [Sphingomonas sp. H39-1-10]|uniref:hypothetical protein n=1 Tax=Sphingomonas pollutisoli TaxID=3030829 RepID=UPI0023B8E551|nr:hypothetical protein [Sphingomonas pollutisoli]MDF0490034.1 hypothetical protein [Sphingomonas pollutisoli]